jgi:hypothetical protein
MQAEYPWDQMSDVDGSRWSSACVQDKFCAFIVEVKDGVEISVAEKNFSFKLKVELTSVAFHSLEKFWR